MKSLEQFKTDTLGGTYGNPGTNTFKGQCVSYVRLYMEEVLGIKTAPWGNAVDYWTNPKVLEHFDRIPKGQTPNEGDIPVWEDDAGAWTGAAGHIGIIYGQRLLNQNFNGSLKVTLNNMFEPGLLGYLRKKEEAMPKITREQIIWHYRLIAGVDPNAQEIANYEGKDYEWVTEQLKRYIANAGRGYNEYIATTQKQIAELEAGSEYIKVSELYVKKETI